jgi:Ion channel
MNCFDDVMVTKTTCLGDYSPQTAAGRSFFLAWALLGVATMTILISSTLAILFDHSYIDLSSLMTSPR